MKAAIRSRNDPLEGFSMIGCGAGSEDSGDNDLADMLAEGAPTDSAGSEGGSITARLLSSPWEVVISLLADGSGEAKSCTTSST